MNRLTELIREDMKPALGVTEPGEVIAFAAAKARSYTNGAVLSVIVRLNSGMYKNAFTCGIPNSREVGSEFAAALGVIAGNWELGLGSSFGCPAGRYRKRGAACGTGKSTGCTPKHFKQNFYRGGREDG